MKTPSLRPAAHFIRISILASAVSTVFGAEPASRYEVIDLGLPEDARAVSSGISANGVIYGPYYKDYALGFAYHPETGATIIPPNNGTQTDFRGMSDEGIVAGHYLTPETGYAFRYENGALITLPPELASSSDVYAINAQGDIAGAVATLSTKALIWRANGSVESIAPPGAEIAVALSINDNGAALIYSTIRYVKTFFVYDKGDLTEIDIPDVPKDRIDLIRISNDGAIYGVVAGHVCEIRDGTATRIDLPDCNYSRILRSASNGVIAVDNYYLGRDYPERSIYQDGKVYQFARGSYWSFVHAIARSGAVIGEYREMGPDGPGSTRKILFNNGVSTELDIDPAGISPNGRLVVGSGSGIWHSPTGSWAGRLAKLWVDGKSYTLNNFIDPYSGWYLGLAYSVNDNGQIVCRGFLDDGPERLVLLNPIDEPTPDSDPTPQPTPDQDPTPEATPNPEPTPVPEPSPTPEPNPGEEPTPQPTPDSSSDPNPTPNPTTSPTTVAGSQFIRTAFWIVPKFPRSDRLSIRMVARDSTGSGVIQVTLRGRGIKAAKRSWRTTIGQSRSVVWRPQIRFRKVPPTRPLKVRLIIRSSGEALTYTLKLPK